MKKLLSIAIILTFSMTLFAQEKVNLPSGATLTIYLPDSNKVIGTCMLVIPGGAYTFLATETEGTPIALSLKQRGITAYVLEYRLPNYHWEIPLTDVREAMQYIRAKQKRHPVGVIGFSAGGHLAATLGTQYKNKTERPDFMVLVYPVISMQDSLTHKDSRLNLLGGFMCQRDKDAFSAELQVNKHTPPTYLTHAIDDRLVSYRNSVVMYQALQKAGIKSELKLVPKGDHGFIQRIPDSEWLDPIFHFLINEHLINETNN